MGKVPQSGAEGQVEHPRVLFMELKIISSETINQGPEREGLKCKSHSILEISEFVGSALLNHMRLVGRCGVVTLVPPYLPSPLPIKAMKTPASVCYHITPPGSRLWSKLPKGVRRGTSTQSSLS